MANCRIIEPLEEFRHPLDAIQDKLGVLRRSRSQDRLLDEKARKQPDRSKRLPKIACAVVEGAEKLRLLLFFQISGFPAQADIPAKDNNPPDMRFREAVGYGTLHPTPA